jgi:hypothetical protein
MVVLGFIFSGVDEPDPLRWEAEVIIAFVTVPVGRLASTRERVDRSFGC